MQAARTSMPAGGGLSRIWMAPPTSRLRLVVDTRGTETEPLTSARLLLIADVLARLVGVLRVSASPIAALQLSGGALDHVTALAGMLSIREPLVQVDPRPRTQFQGLTQDQVVLTTDPCRASSTWAPPDRAVFVGRVQGPTSKSLSALATSGIMDPLAIRLAILRSPPTRTATLTHARVKRADETLQRWRFKVAGWADMPQAASPPGPTAASFEKLTLDLDTRAVLTALHRVETDPRIPSGAKFALFSSLDRTLGLNLCRLVGRRRP